jgi:diguanylate cyclase
LKQLKKVCTKALNDLEKVLGNRYRDEILRIQELIQESDNFDYILSQRKNLIELVRRVTTDIQVEKEEITKFLLEISEKLSLIEQEFSASTETSSKYHTEDVSFSSKIETEIQKVSESFNTIDSLDSLRSFVTSKLDFIRDALRSKQNEYSNRMEKAQEEQQRLKSSFKTVINTVREKNRILEKQSRMDPLTGIYNRRVFEESINAELDRSKRYGTPFSLIFFDIDRFKVINDTYGHEVGDKVLKAIAHRVSEMLRKPDIFARYGGEEFVVILPETSMEQGVSVAEKLRSEIEDAIFEYEENRVPVTISIGITEVRETDRQFQTIVNRADTFMYYAKERGRNRVISDEDVEKIGGDR